MLYNYKWRLIFGYSFVVMARDKKERHHIKSVASIVRISTSMSAKDKDSVESDESLFDDDDDREENDDDSVFDDERDEDGEEKTVQKDSEGGAVVKDRKDSGEQGGRPVRILTMDEIRK